jgi:adenosylcobyric acid synthase
LVAGCYVHGLFSSDAFCAAWISSLVRPAQPDPLPRGRGSSGVLSPFGERNRVRGDFPLAYETLIEQTLDELAAHLAGHVDTDALLRLMR